MRHETVGKVIHALNNNDQRIISKIINIIPKKITCNSSLNLYAPIKLDEIQKEKEASADREALQNIQKQYEQVKSMLSLLGLVFKQFSKSRRATNSTSKGHDK